MNFEGEDLAVQTSYVKQIKDYNIRQAWPLTKKSALLVIGMQCYYTSIA